MADELPAHEPLVSEVVAEGVARAAVHAGEPGAGADRRLDVVPMLALEPAHRPVRDDEVHFLQVRGVRQRLHRLVELDIDAVLRQAVAEHLGRLDRVVETAAFAVAEYKSFHARDSFPVQSSRRGLAEKRGSCPRPAHFIVGVAACVNLAPACY